MKDKTDNKNVTQTISGLTAHERQRRNILKGATAVTAASTVFGAPLLWAQNIKDVTLRQFGTGVSNLNDVAAKVKEDLGFTLEMTALDSDSVAQRAATQPKSFDIADIEYWICKKVWPAGNLQPMDTSKIENYDKIVGIFRNGKLTPESVIAQGTAPHTVGFVDGPDGKEFVDNESGWMTLIPTIYNADTLGIRPDLIDEATRSKVQRQSINSGYLINRHHGCCNGL